MPPLVRPEAQPERSLWRILKEAWGLYVRHGLALTRPLAMPVLMQLLGTLAIFLLPFYLMEAGYQWLFSQAPLVRIGAPLMTILPGTVMLAWGFWRYLLYVASLNSDVISLLEGQPASPRENVHRVPPGPYARMVLLYSLVWAPGPLVYIMGLLLMLLMGGAAGLMVFALGFLMMLLLLAASFIVAIYLSLVFQVFALEEAQASPLRVLRRSAVLVTGNFWRTLALQTVLLVVTAVFLPWLAMALLDSIHLTDLFMPLGYYVSDYLLEGYEPQKLQTLFKGRLDPLTLQFYGQLYQELLASREQLAREQVHGFLALGVTLLLLPLGTAAFSLLYLDCRHRRDQ